MIESRGQFLKRFARMDSAALSALMLVGAVGCGGEEDDEGGYRQFSRIMMVGELKFGFKPPTTSIMRWPLHGSG